MTRFILAMLLISGCATVPNRHERPNDSMDRTIALASYNIGGLIGFGGCVAGFITLSPIALPICIGGWACGVGGITYLAWDDYERGKSWQKVRMIKDERMGRP